MLVRGNWMFLVAALFCLLQIPWAYADGDAHYTWEFRGDADEPASSLSLPLPQSLSSDLAPSRSPDGLVEYLYIDANEDKASGGHTAVRIDEDVFHFQFKNGLLAMSRDSWPDFQLSYRGYQNRSIYATRLAISDDTYKLLRSSFVHRHLVQSRQVQLLTDSRRDVELFDALQSASTAQLRLAGFGFFAPLGQKVHGGRRAGLQAAIASAYGADYLQQRSMALRQQLDAMAVVEMSFSVDDFTAANFPQAMYPFNQRYADNMAALHAVEVIQSDAALSAQSLRLALEPADSLPLLPEERAWLLAASEQLQGRLVDLLASERPDWGSAVLLGLARLEAMRLSVAENRWVFIDVLADDANIVDVGPRTRRMLPLLRVDALAVWEYAKYGVSLPDGWDERRYAQMETAGINLLELQRLERGASDWRIHTAPNVPAGTGLVPQVLQPRAVQVNGQDLLQRMRQSHQLAQEFAGEQMAYKLLTRNCVSELFTTVDLAMAEALARRSEPVDELAVERETQRRLGAHFAPNPIPFVSANQVDEHWRVAGREDLLSLRRLYTRAELQASATPITTPITWLRESNTLTSSVFTRSDGDSFFVFFTDGSPWARPALGLVNLGAALGASVVGAVQAPFDRGRQLRAGLRGAMFSLPELGFQNIRKGRNTWLSPTLLSVPIDQPQPAANPD
jgi:hypothetical protein